LRDQHASDSRDVVARVESVPAPADIGLEPASKISGGIRRWHADIPKVASAVARRNVHAATERDGEMRIVAANAFAFIEDFPCRHGRPRVFIAERDVVVNKIASEISFYAPVNLGRKSR